MQGTKHCFWSWHWRNPVLATQDVRQPALSVILHTASVQGLGHSPPDILILQAFLSRRCSGNLRDISSTGLNLPHFTDEDIEEIKSHGQGYQCTEVQRFISFFSSTLHSMHSSLGSVDPLEVPQETPLQVKGKGWRWSRTADMGVWFIFAHEGLIGSLLSQCPTLGTVYVSQGCCLLGEDLGQACPSFFYFSHPTPLHPTSCNKYSHLLSHQAPV